MLCYQSTIVYIIQYKVDTYILKYCMELKIVASKNQSWKFNELS